MFSIRLIFSLVLTFNACLCINKNGLNKYEVEKEWLNSVFNGYDSRIRPPGNSTLDGPVTVRTNLYVRSVQRLDEKSMTFSLQITYRLQWVDKRLAFDTRGKVTHLNVNNSTNIWIPDIFFTNSVSEYRHGTLVPNSLLRVYEDGNILFSTRISLTLSCPMDLKYFPLDTQTCTIKMASYGYTSEDLVMIWKEGNPVQISKLLYLPHFTLTSFNTDDCTARTNTGEYSCLILRFNFQRESSFYVRNYFLPSLVLILLSWMTFWLSPTETCTRMLTCIASLFFSYLNHLQLINLLPQISYTTYAGVWSYTCLTFTLLAILETVFVIRSVDRYSVKEDEEGFNVKAKIFYKLDVIARIAFLPLFVCFQLFAAFLFINA